MQKTNKRKDVTHPHFVSVKLTDTEMALLDQGTSMLGISRSSKLSLAPADSAGIGKIHISLISIRCNNVHKDLSTFNGRQLGDH